ncbi:MAG: VOC family protein [Allorhizobium sp.]|jgi:glyoxylase I family protein|uniref:VOC family protein n=1 Tax=Allorhizobium sp. TaxID=633478 RepID=UPI004033778E
MLKTKKLNNICYFVTDIERTARFYGETLGLPLQRMENEPGEPDWLIASTANGIDLLFFQVESKPGNSPIVVFDLEEGGIDDMVEGLAEQGVTIVTPVSHSPGGWSAEFADPDGHTLSMYQTAEMPRQLKAMA